MGARREARGVQEAGRAVISACQVSMFPGFGIGKHNTGGNRKTGLWGQRQRQEQAEKLS